MHIHSRLGFTKKIIYYFVYFWYCLWTFSRYIWEKIVDEFSKLFPEVKPHVRHVLIILRNDLSKIQTNRQFFLLDFLLKAYHYHLEQVSIFCKDPSVLEIIDDWIKEYLNTSTLKIINIPKDESFIHPFPSKRLRFVDRSLDISYITPELTKKINEQYSKDLEGYKRMHYKSQKNSPDLLINTGGNLDLTGIPSFYMGWRLYADIPCSGWPNHRATECLTSTFTRFDKYYPDSLILREIYGDRKMYQPIEEKGHNTYLRA